jgi:hypothetical protein
MCSSTWWANGCGGPGCELSGHHGRMQGSRYWMRAATWRRPGGLWGCRAWTQPPAERCTPCWTSCEASAAPTCPCASLGGQPSNLMHPPLHPLCLQSASFLSAGLESSHLFIHFERRRVCLKGCWKKPLWLSLLGGWQGRCSGGSVLCQSGGGQILCGLILCPVPRFGASHDC